MNSGKSKVLVVDDTPENIQILMETLRDEFAVVTAINGTKALSLAMADAPPDIILLDVMMPGLDGYEVCRRLKETPKTRSIPVIFITALSDEKDEARGLELGAVDFIAKPFQPSLVKARVKNHIELKRHRDSLEAVVERQVREIATSHMATIMALSKLAESRDDDTGKHLERTQTYCKMLALEAGQSGAYAGKLDDRFAETIFWASPLHDIGKVAVPDAILCKPGKLTSEEFDIMKTHTTRGADTLRAVATQYPGNYFIQMGLDIAHWHHEKWNGKGYPDGIAGENVPVCARIMAVADVYDALTSKRCYKEAMPHEKAMEIIQNDSGTHFDPVMVEIFLRIEGEFRRVKTEMGN